MLKWWRQYQQASSATKVFILITLTFGLSIVITTIYCYARLDYVRSYKTAEIAHNPLPHP